MILQNKTIARGALPGHIIPRSNINLIMEDISFIIAFAALIIALGTAFAIYCRDNC